MDAKKIIILIVLGIGALVILNTFGLIPNFFEQQTENTQPEVEAYASGEHGLAFAYPANFELREMPLTNEGISWSAITLADKEVLRQAQENGASEGPPLIAVQVFPNAENLTAEKWVRTSRFSNFALAVNGAMGSSTVGGVEGVGYIYSGLFATDTVVVAHAGKIYMFSVDWITEEDKNRQTFDAILGSVQFI